MDMTAQSLHLKHQDSLGYSGHTQRITPELVFVFVEPIGGGAKKAAEHLKRLLESDPYHYKTDPIKISTLIEKEAKRRNYEEPTLPEQLADIERLSDIAKKINKLQQFGNKLRKDFGCDYLARTTVREIANYRMSHDGMEQADGAILVPKPLRVAHIVLSIKHPDELKLLRSVYGDLMFLIAVSGSYEQQLNNYRQKEEVEALEQTRREEYSVLFDIDQYEGVQHGQGVREIFYQANLFVSSENRDIEEQLTNFLELLFRYKIGSPTQDERMMFEAFSASLRSTCLSRQVGAAISDSDGELISVGWNDVPKYGGGLACEGDCLEGSSLCKRKGYCRSNVEIKKLCGDIYQKLKNQGMLLDSLQEDEFEATVKKAGISGLIEFSRAIHAEMEAILSAARTAKQGLKKAKLYVTTYPCENCVKHILAAGIEEVIYIEPYIKSRAVDFFSDFVVAKCDYSRGDSKLVLSQFAGISPHSYQKIYQKNGKRKAPTGEVIPHSSDPLPITMVYLDSFALYESRIAEELIDE